MSTLETSARLAGAAIEDAVRITNEDREDVLTRVIRSFSFELDARHSSRPLTVLDRQDRWWLVASTFSPDRQPEVTYTAYLPSQNGGNDQIGEVDVVGALWEQVHQAYTHLPSLIPADVLATRPQVGSSCHIRSLRSAPPTPASLRLLLAGLVGLATKFWRAVSDRCQESRGWSDTTLAADPWVSAHLAIADLTLSNLATQAQHDELSSEQVNLGVAALAPLHDEALRLVGARANYLTNDIGLASRHLLAAQDLALLLTRPPAIAATPCTD